METKKKCQKKEKKAGMCHSFFLETNLCMPIRVEHFDSFTHVQMFVVFSKRLR